MTLLSLVQRTCDLLSIPRPTSVVSSQDQQVRQLYALANEEGDELARDNDWQALRIEQTFTTTAAAEQVAAIPADLDRFVNNSFFNRTQMRPLIGPITPQQWQAILAQPQLNRVFLAFIEREGQFLVTPTPTAGETVAYEYFTRNWAKSAALVPQSEYLADEDLTYLDERLISLGVRWRFLQAKGLDYAEAMRTYEREKQKVKARDGANGILSASGGNDWLLANLPVGNFPGP